jgi:tetratricopeptide (TPR) repeat protein
MARFRIVVVCAALVAALAGGQARAEDSDVARAKKTYTRGMAHYHLREYVQAISAFEEAYRIHPDPVFLYNIAQAHRLSDKPEEALHFYRTYLRAAPKAANKREVDGRIEELQAVVNAKRNAATAPPQGPLTPSGTVTKTIVEPTPPSTPPTPPPALPPPSPSPEPIVKSPYPSPPPVAPVAPERRRTKPWVWGVVAGGVIVAAGLAVGLGVGLTVGRESPSSYPSVSYALEGGVR